MYVERKKAIPNKFHGPDYFQQQRETVAWTIAVYFNLRSLDCILLFIQKTVVRPEHQVHAFAHALQLAEHFFKMADQTMLNYMKTNKYNIYVLLICMVTFLANRLHA